MRPLLVAALAAPALLAGAAQAQNKPAATPQAPSTPAAAAPAKPEPATEADRRIQEAVQREVARLKEELRDEVRAEIQGAQSAAAFLGPIEEKPRLEFLEIDGYLRFRADLRDNLDLRRDADPSGYYLYPRPLVGPNEHGTLTMANMRFRLEPTLNVSEQVRVRAQLDLLDNLVLGSTPEIDQRYPMPFGSATQTPPIPGLNSDRPSINVKRAWGEVQTPLGLLSFGRMPDQWGLGMLANPGGGIDGDYGDNVDRIQWAIPLGSTPIGPLTVIPMFDYVWSGVTSASGPTNTAVSVATSTGLGQPFDRDQADDGRGLGVKVVRMDTPDDIRRKLDKGLSSFNYGLWYSYRTQTFDFPGWTLGSQDPASAGAAFPPHLRRDASAHVGDLWLRLETRRLHLEVELAGIYGQIGDARTTIGNSLDPADPNGTPLGPVLIRQFGAVVQAHAKLAGGRFRLGGEFGLASGDRNPGFGNLPGRNAAPVPGDFEGTQFARGDKVLDIRNFRFNRAYLVDSILFREILGGVTDAWYVKPTARYEIFDGLVATAQVVYSQAVYATSTPSTVHNPLGVEPDIGLSYTSDDGFVAWLNYGLLFPLDGFDDLRPGNTTHLTRAHSLRAGLAVKY